MWCHACREDVPAVASFEEGILCCARCGGAVRRNPATAQHVANLVDCGVDLAQDEWGDLAQSDSREASSRDALLDSKRQRPPIDLDWRNDEALWEVSRVLRSAAQASARFSEPPQSASASPRTVRISPVPHSPHFARRGAPAYRRQKRRWSWAWLLVVPGLLAFVCGVAFLAWGLAVGRGDFWGWGLLLALGSQLVLLSGLLFRAACYYCSRRLVSHLLPPAHRRFSSVGG